MVAARLHALELRRRRTAVHGRRSGHAQGRQGGHLRPQAVPGPVAVHAVSARPADRPGARAGAQRQRRGRLRRRHPRGPRGDPARIRDADLRLRRDLSGADDPRPQGPGRDRAPAQSAVVRLQRAPPRRLRPRGPRRAPDGRHRAWPLVRLQLPERAGRGVPLVPRSRSRAHGEDALLRPRRHLSAARRARARARPTRRRVRRAARPGRPRLQQGRLVPLCGERRPRLPRRHDPRQWRGRSAHAGGTTDLPTALPERVQRALLRAAARQRAAGRADRERRRAAAEAGQAPDRRAASGRADRGADRFPPVQCRLGGRADATSRARRARAT